MKVVYISEALKQNQNLRIRHMERAVARQNRAAAISVLPPFEPLAGGLTKLVEALDKADWNLKKGNE